MNHSIDTLTQGAAAPGDAAPIDVARFGLAVLSRSGLSRSGLSDSALRQELEAAFAQRRQIDAELIRLAAAHRRHRGQEPIAWTSCRD